MLFCVDFHLSPRTEKYHTKTIIIKQVNSLILILIDFKELQALTINYGISGHILLPFFIFSSAVIICKLPSQCNPQTSVLLRGTI